MPKNLAQAITTGLDLLGLLAVAAGVGAWSATRIGWAGLAVAGVIVLAGSACATAVSRPGYVPVRTRVAMAVSGLVLRYRVWRIRRSDAKRTLAAAGA